MEDLESSQIDLKEASPFRTVDDETAWHQEIVRNQVVVVLMLLLTAAYGCWAATTSYWPTAKDWLQILLPVETALLGTATGFYFAKSRP